MTTLARHRDTVTAFVGGMYDGADDDALSPSSRRTW